MTHRLSPHVHAACCGEDLVLLNLRQGSYACLPGCAPYIALSTGTTALRVGAQDLAQALVEAGAIETGQAQLRFVAPPAARDLAARRPGRRARPLTMALAWSELARSYWRVPFGEMIARSQRQANGACGDEALVGRLAHDFARMLPWVPAQGVCLYRSCFLLAFLRRHGVSASWVFGVQTYTFEAHCWLQAGDLVLDDHLEHVAGFEPILALEP